jgi:hypothetical protein
MIELILILIRTKKKNSYLRKQTLVHYRVEMSRYLYFLKFVYYQLILLTKIKCLKNNYSLKNLSFTFADTKCNWPLRLIKTIKEPSGLNSNFPKRPSNPDIQQNLLSINWINNSSFTFHHWYLHNLSFDHIINFKKISITGNNHLISISSKMSCINRISFKKEGLNTFIFLSINLILFLD